MAAAICRVLRDGALEGEHAPALTINDSIDSPAGPAVFNYVFSQLSSFVLAGKSQSRGVVLVALSRSPSFYSELLKSSGIDMTTTHNWLRILDCYTDPLGWKDQLKGIIRNSSIEDSVTVKLCKDVRNLDEMLSSLLALGKALAGEGKNRFCVAVDSVSEMLRHTSLSSVASLLSNLRGHGLVSSIFWLLHSDLQEMKAAAVLEYMSSMVANIRPLVTTTDVPREKSDNLSLLEQNNKKGKFHASIKRRNGRVRVMCEEFSVEQSGVIIASVSAGKDTVSQSLVPKVQFNLQLTEKERNDRAKVVLPFEHQEMEKSTQIYDGRKSTIDVKDNSKAVGEVQKEEDSRRGEIIYFRDSDDEMPDSDEDPDDDLDI